MFSLTQPITVCPLFSQEPASENPASENPASENPASENPASENPASQEPGSAAGSVPAKAESDAGVSVPATVEAQSESPSLHVRIDAALDNGSRLLIAGRAADGELLRRLSLDLRGVVPNREELDAFVADTSDERWQNWVRRFLEDPLCDEHLVNFLDRTLMMRRAHTLVDRASWTAFLREQVASNTPLDAFSRQLLFAPWWNQEQRVSQKFFLDRAGDPNLVARDLGRIFLGQDLQCAQCHDHPIVEDYKQTDYHGLLAFFSPSKLAEATYKDAEGKDQKLQQYIESPAGDAAFESVFNAGVPYRSGPRLPGNTEEFEGYLLPDERLLPAPPDGALGGLPIPPKHSRRQLLAEQLASRRHEAFVANWANRLWAMMFGQGLVHPVDMRHADNPPVQPEVFTLITDGLVELNMEPRLFLEQLALTQAYQRGHLGMAQVLGQSSPTEELRAAAESMRAAALVQLEPLEKSDYAARQQYENAEDTWSDIQANRAAIRTELDAAEAVVLAEKKKADEAAAALDAAGKAKLDAQTRIGLLDEAAAKLQQAVDLGGSDAELESAIALGKQRAEALRASVPKLDEAVAAAEASAQAAAMTLAQAKEKNQEVLARLQPIQQSLLDADRAMLAARDQWSRTHVARLDNESRRAYAANTIAWLDSVKEQELVRASIDPLAMTIDAAEQQRQANAVQVAESKSLNETARNDLATEEEALAITKSTIEGRMREVEQLRQSLAALDQAAKLIPTPESLDTAKAAISMEMDNRQIQMAESAAQLKLAEKRVKDSASEAARASQALESLEAEALQIHQQIAMAREQLEAKQAELRATSQRIDELWTSIHSHAVRQLDAAGLYALTPEQLCWSTLRITGHLEAYINVERAELEKQSPIAQDADEATKAARERQAVRAAFDKLRGNADVFVSLYASGPDKTQDDFFASADQALFIANAGSVFSWAGPGNNNVTQQAIAMTDAGQIANGLYWTLLCRQPTPAETQLVTEQLASAGEERAAVIQEMVWGILASAEFRFSR